MFAVIETGGKQYLIKTGDVIKIEKLELEVGKEHTFDKVLLTAKDDGTDVKIGTPYLEDASITFEVKEQGRDKKIRVIKYKRKTRYKRTIGHRQKFTKAQIKT